MEIINGHRSGNYGEGGMNLHWPPLPHSCTGWPCWNGCHARPDP